MSIQESLRIVPRGNVALLEWDLVGEKVNKLSTPVMTRLQELLEELNGSDYKAVVVISRKPNVFIAGADIEEIRTLRKREDVFAKVQTGQAIISMFEDLKMPVIAAVHGAAVGGGCELILTCDYRIASDDPATRIGLSEVKLGLIPGWGGCWRLPRVIGLQAALDIILQGKTVDAKKAQKLGLVDRVVHPSLLEEQALKLAHELILEGKGKRKKRFKAKKAVDSVLESALGRSLVFSQARKAVLKQTHGHYPAPLRAIEVVRKIHAMSDRAAALRIEAEGVTDMLLSEVSRNLVSVYFLMEGVKHKTGVADPEIRPKKIKAMGILGAGTMGGGIAFIAADKELEVRLKDVKNDALARGFKAAAGIWGKLLKKHKATRFDVIRKQNHISGGLDYSGFGQLDVVVEAIIEDMGVKQKVIGETAKHCRPDCIIATNTSSLSVTEMAKGHPNPANFAGMHFFNPVDKMPLVEVIRGEKTSDETTATIFELSKKLGKVPVVVKDGPGFLVNRLLYPYLAEAAYFIEEGMAITTVDELFVKEFGMPMGPFHLMDEIGIDVCIKVSKIFRDSFGPRMEISGIMSRLADTKRLGKKNRKGFYLWDEHGKKLGEDETIYAELGLRHPRDPLSSKEVLQRSLFSMINEAALVLYEDRIVETAEEVDLAMIMGTGFPPFRGGLLRYADSLGSAYIADELEIYAAHYGARFKPSNPLRNMAKTKRSFYS